VSRQGLIRLLLILIAAWGILSTTVVATFVLSHEANPTTGPSSRW
jgi:hypothetical protein